MLLEAVGEKSASEKVINAIETVLREGQVRTYDLGGNSKMSEVGDAIVSEMKMGG
jgi:isocitrate/isopropylmalate dehydrogenase